MTHSLGYRRPRIDVSTTDRAKYSERNDALLSIPAFREFLAEIMNRAGYFRPSVIADGYTVGRAAAFREIADGVILNSTKGEEMVAEYIRSFRANIDKTEKGETE